MTNPQIWTMIGAFSAVMFGGFGLMVRVLKAEVGGLRSEMRAEVGALRSEMRAEMGGLRSEMDARFDALDQRIDQKVDGLAAITAARFTDVDHRLEALETDMHLIKGHLIGQRSA